MNNIDRKSYEQYRQKKDVNKTHALPYKTSGLKAILERKTLSNIEIDMIQKKVYYIHILNVKV